MWTHECVRAERKEDQILRTEIATGGEIGGEWMSAAQGDEPNSGIIAILSIGGSAWAKTNPKCVELPSKELLIVAR